MGPVLYYYALNRYIIIFIFYDQDDNAHIIPADSLSCDFARSTHTRVDFAPGTSFKELTGGIFKKHVSVIIQHTNLVSKSKFKQHEYFLVHLI
jgi:hypothetical protein